MIRNAYLIVSVALAFPAHAAVLVEDNFSDTDRIGGLSGASTTAASPTVNTPTSSNTQWTANRVSQLVASATGMLWTMDTNSRLVAGYFPTITLADNTSTTFTLGFTTGTVGAIPNNLRVSLTDGTANGIRTTDAVGTTDATYADDVGYAFFSSTNLGGGFATPLGMNTRERTLTTSTNLLGTAAEWTAIGSGVSATSGNFEGGTAYTMAFTFSRSGSSMDITQSITGGSIVGMSFTVTDATAIVTDLNQINFRLGGGSNQFSSINFTEFSVEQVAIPEPSSTAVLGMLAALGLCRRRRTAACP